ncbi:MAG: MFS transporter [Bacteroidota bacterium]
MKGTAGSNRYGDEQPTSILGYRQTWAFIVGKFLTDPVWWFYLFWLPSFLNKQYHMSKTELALPIAVVYTMTTVGSVYGGWLSGNLIKRGWEVYKARRFAMLVFALCVIPIVTAQALGQYSHWFAILIVGFAASAHQAWSANLFTTTSDMFPKKAVASVTGFGGMAGGIGGILIAKTAGIILDHFKALGSIETGYYIMFIICGSIYLFAWVIFNVLAPKMKRVEL